MENVVGLTALPLSLRTALVERACNMSTIGLSHLNNLASPFLNSSNAPACSWNISRIESRLSQPFILSASGWCRRSFPVCLVYLTKAASKRIWKLEVVEVVLEAEDMGCRMGEMSEVLSGKEGGLGDAEVKPFARPCAVRYTDKQAPRTVLDRITLHEATPHKVNPSNFRPEI